MEIDDSINPFGEEFDEKDVINRGDYVPFNEEFDKKDVVNGKEREEKPVKPAIELADIVSDGRGLAVIGKDPDEDEFFGLIKKEAVDRGDVQVKELHEFDEEDQPEIPEANDEANELIDDFDDDLTADSEPEEPDEPIDSVVPDGKSPEEVNDEYLQKHFRDFITIPKISGNFVKSIENNLIPKDIVNKTGKIVEIADDLPHSTKPGHQTSVLINRDETGELESIEVICKCGERTLITFDYISAKDYDSDLTEIEDDPYEPIPFEDLEREEGNVMIVNPSILNIPTEEEEAEMIRKRKEEEKKFNEEDEDDEDFDYMNYDFDDDED